MIWVPRSLNEQADFFSRVVDADDWGVVTEVILDLSLAWGVPTIDRFADASNTHCGRFNSRFFSPGTEAINAFTQDWATDLNLLVPPLYLIPRVLAYLRLCQARGILIFPAWKSALYWLDLVKLQLESPSPILDTVYMGNVFKLGRNTLSMFGSERWQGSSIAMFLSFQVMHSTSYYNFYIDINRVTQ